MVQQLPAPVAVIILSMHLQRMPIITQSTKLVQIPRPESTFTSYGTIDMTTSVLIAVVLQVNPILIRNFVNLPTSQRFSKNRNAYTNLVYL